MGISLTKEIQVQSDMPFNNQTSFIISIEPFAWPSLWRGKAIKYISIQRHTGLCFWMISANQVLWGRHVGMSWGPVLLGREVTVSINSKADSANAWFSKVPWETAPWGRFSCREVWIGIQGPGKDAGLDCLPEQSRVRPRHRWTVCQHAREAQMGIDFPSTRGKRQQNFISPVKRGEREKRKAITRKHKKQETQNSSQPEMRRTQESVCERWRCGRFILLLFERAQHSQNLIFGRFRSTRCLPPSSSGPVLLWLRCSHEHR